jgi:hypothetical protein
MDTKVLCYYFHNTNQTVLKEAFEYSARFFMPILELRPIEFHTKVSSSNFGTLEFRQLMMEKVVRVKEIIKTHMLEEKTILVSDIDIIIYSDFSHLIQLPPTIDVMFQKENSTCSINTGFIMLKCSPQTYQFWCDIETKMLEVDSSIFVNEQVIVNQIINTSLLKWALFPNEIWAFSNDPKPETIFLHHANCTGDTRSLHAKCEQLISFLKDSTSLIKDILISILSI